jgi:hypothetical protein
MCNENVSFNSTFGRAVCMIALGNAALFATFDEAGGIGLQLLLTRHTAPLRAPARKDRSVGSLCSRVPSRPIFTFQPMRAEVNIAPVIETGQF